MSVVSRLPPIKGDPNLLKACDRKNRYTTEEWGRKVGRDMLRLKGGPARLWLYACPQCRGWHLTKTPNKGLAITARQTREGLS